MNQLITKSKQLAAFDREMQSGFVLPVMLGEPDMAVTHILRHIPGKRMTALANWGQQAVLLKCYFHPYRARRQALAEQQGITALCQRAILTPRLIYAGPSQATGVHVVISEYLPQAVSLAEKWRQCDNLSQQWQILEKLIPLVASHHQTGLCQQDLHLDNFLLYHDDIYTIDGQAIKIHHASRELCQRVSFKNLALLLVQLRGADLQLMTDIYSHYIRCRQWQVNQDDFDKLHMIVRQYSRKRRQKYLAKSIRNCSEFAANKTFFMRAVTLRDCDAAALRPFLQHPEDFFARAADIIYLKRGNTCTVVKITINSRQYVVKRYNLKSFTHAIGRSIRKTRAMTSWQNSQRLKLLGIACPKAIAVIEKRFGWLRRQAYFVSEYCEGQTLLAYLQHYQYHPDLYRPIIGNICHIFKQLKQAAIIHGDMKASNILVTDDGLRLVDLDSMREFTCRRKFTQAFTGELQRFLKNWQQTPVLEQQFSHAFQEEFMI